ncbi:hypothetical protein [Synechococcus sp. M16CYN]|uniref:hypothetical protein n=1 Tax=Synechococcus sp. M16CYN TaxID=3103139 RepID=UPI003342400A
MLIERLEQVTAVVVTAGLVAGNLLLFTPFRKGYDSQEYHNQPIHSRSVEPSQTTTTPSQ